MADDPTQPAETAQIPVNEPLSEPPVEQNTGSTGQAIPEPTPQAEASMPSEPAEPVREAVQEPAPAPAEPPVEQNTSSTGQAPQSEPPEMPEIETAPPQPAAQAAQQAPANPTLSTSPQAARELLVKARAKVQTQKQKKLDKIMAEIEKNGKISNDEVEKLLHCSDATASRYLSALEKQGKIKKVGTTGAGVVYIKA